LKISQKRKSPSKIENMVSRQDVINALTSYDPNCNIALVNKAMDFAVEYHGTQTRESGAPYFQHPFEVAYIITDMHLDSTCVITAILHDTIEDTDLTLEDIEREFGEEIATLVDGVTKLTKIEFQPDHVRQAENFRKFLLAISNDIRVLLIKLADRLHNMRTIDFISSPEKRMRIALETMEIYGPLAERIGVQQIKLELQDLAFKIVNPDVRASILSRLKELSDDGDKLVKQIVVEIKNTLDAAGIKAQVSGRQKTPFSIWMKMKQKNMSFEQLSDIIAFRIIVTGKDECYAALGATHCAYQMVPGSFQDFISTPKANGYQSLHTLVIGPLQKRIEIQIRTKQMHQIAEFGVAAAHRRYKQGYKAADHIDESWIKDLLGMSEHSFDSEEFLQNTKLSMYYDQVFCFTPKGSLIALPKGATIVDFAYAVHSDIGHRCTGAKVNGRTVPLRHCLINGDQVEIILCKEPMPSPAWEKFVVTGKARFEIRRFIKAQQRNQYVTLGRSILEKALKSTNLKDLEIAISEVANKLKKKNATEVYQAVGEGVLSREEVLGQVQPTSQSLHSRFSFFKFKKTKPTAPTDQGATEAVPIQGLIPGLAVHFASCCHPLPGDNIMGIIHTGKGITIHTSDCEMLSNFSSTPDRVIELSWDADSSNIPYICRFKATLLNEPGSLAILCSEVAKDGANITNLKFSDRSEDFFEITVDVEVVSLVHLTEIIARLQEHRAIHSAERCKT
jgi:guanosine-3',5'-bis(diphosphate) 3'-pyrophosphohydrolase